MSAERKIQRIARKMLRLLEVHIFFAMSVLAGNAVVKHLSVSISKSQDKRQRVAIERSLPLLHCVHILEAFAIEKGSFSGAKQTSSQDWLFLFPHIRRLWLSQEVSLTSYGEPPRLAFNLLQELIPLRI
ncbi:MAG: hypothetical protein ACK42Y_11005 [Candidatus Thermochlorobacter sp.]